VSMQDVSSTRAERRVGRPTNILAGIERATGKDPRPLTAQPIPQNLEQELCRDEP